MNQQHFAKYLGKQIWNNKTFKSVKLTGVRLDSLQYINGSPEEENGNYNDFNILVQDETEVLQNNLPIGLAVIEVMRTVVKEAIPMTPPYFLQNLKNIVYKIDNVTEASMQLNKGTNKRKYSEPRQVIMAVWFKTFQDNGVSCNMASNLYGKDHATALHAVKKVNNLLKTNKDFRNKYSKVWKYALSVNHEINLEI